MDDWKEPREVDNITLAFPANIIGTLLPLEGELGEFRKNWTSNPWCQQAQQWFGCGVDIKKSTIEFADHIDTDEKARGVVRQLHACLGSFEPSHEHKIAGVGYLMSLFFKKLVIVSPKKDDNNE